MATKFFDDTELRADLIKRGYMSDPVKGKFTGRMKREYGEWLQKEYPEEARRREEMNLEDSLKSDGGLHKGWKHSNN